MKKTLTLLIILATAFTSYAQKNIDLSLDTVLAPQELVSDYETGTAIPYHIVCKNNGSDTIEAGDTILYGWALYNLSNDNELMFDQPTGFASGENAFLFSIDKQIVPGDTFSIKQNYSTGAAFLNSVDIRFITRCHVNLKDFTSVIDANSANDEVFYDLVWYNQNKFGVSIEDVSYNNNISIYPNPASGDVSIKLNYVSIENTVVEIININGQVVLQDPTIDAFGNITSFNTSELENGVYIVKVTAGDKVMTSKLTIAH